MPDSRTVLVVEDSTLDASLILAALRTLSEPCPVALVPSGEAAVDYLHRRGVFAGRADEDPSVVLLDVVLPAMSGFDVLTEIRNDAQLAHMPVVMVATSDHPSDVARSYALHANAYVIKPRTFDAFVSLIGDVGHFWSEVNVLPRAGCGTRNAE